MDIHTPPPIVNPAPLKRGICISEKYCFKMDPPKNKEVKKENAFRTQYYIRRMKMHAKKAQDPDMNMTLNEIKTGVKLSERMTLTLTVYLLGVLAILWNM